MDDKNAEILKLQEDLATITAEWKNKSGQDIRSLRESFKQAAQIERARIARLESVPRVDDNDEGRRIQIMSNVRFKRQNIF